MSGRATGQLARAGLLLVISGGLSRLLGWLRLIVITAVFGASAELDAYFAAFRLPDALLHLAAGSVLGSVLIPLIARLRQADEERAWRLTRTVALVIGSLLGVLALAAFVAAPLLVPLIAPGFDAPQQELVVRLSRIMLVSPICFGLGAVLQSVLHSEGQFLAAALAPLVYNLSIIAAALLLAPVLGIDALAVGVAVGAVGFLLLQLLPLLRHPVLRGATARPLALRDAELSESLVRLGPRVLGLAGAQLLLLTSTALASGLGTGAVTGFTLAHTLLQVLVGLLGVPLGVVVFPALARSAAQGAAAEYRRMLAVGSRFLAWTALPTTFVGVLLAGSLVSTIFGHGRLSEAALETIAATFAVLLAGLLASSLNLLLSRGFYAQGNTSLPVLTTLAQVGLAVAVALAGLSSLGLTAIALGIVLGSWLRTATLLVLLAVHYRAELMAELGRAVLAMLVPLAAAVLAAAGGLALARALPLDGLPASVAEVLLAGGPGAAAYGLASWLLRLPELRHTLHWAASLLGRGVGSEDAASEAGSG